MKFLVPIFLCFPLLGLAQINFQLGQALTLGNTKTSYVVNDENYIATYISDYRKLGTETFFKVSSYKHWDSTKFAVQYTLQFGLKYYQYYTESSHLFNEIYETDLQGASYYHNRSVSWMNGVDLIYRINQNLTLVNTIGVKLEVINRTLKEKIWGTGGTTLFFKLPADELPLTNPTIKFTCAPQLLIHFNKFSLGVHVNQDLFLVNNLINNVSDRYLEFGKVHLSNFTTLGISIMPNFYLVPNPEFVDSVE